MARPKLDREQRAVLLMWLAADYDSGLIFKWFQEREWPQLSRRGLTHYRKSCAGKIEQLRAERREKAITTGLALKEERIARLSKHADTLEAIKWVPDDKGRLWNEKAWRETLDDIAKEMGERKQRIEHSGKIRLEALEDEELEQLEGLIRKTADSG